MKSRLLKSALLAASVCALYAADATPTAESILDHYVEVTGGKAAYAKRTSESMQAKVEFPAANITGKITRYAASPDKYYSVMELPGIGNIEMGYSEGVAWEKSAMLGPRVKTGAELADAVREATLNASAEWRKLYSKATLEGVEKVDGEDCYKVVLTPATGRPLTMYYQKKSGLAVKMETIAASSQIGEIPVTILVTDYKNFGGVWAPARTTQKAQGQEFSITVEKVDLNPEIPAEKFALPAEIKALVAKSKAAAK
jgi:outer membrane lipoprotein-sorting protein